ncbi:MAG: HPF/RaiA family ribosome-associated protein [Thermoanaerobaculia bacterium]|nr:HPF/RaiA family ribosome-associated protein [Thermoanaerobaculia bacterium]
MTVNIQSLRFKASDNLQAHVQEKVQKLFDVNGRIIRADVTLYEDGGAPAKQFCEIKLLVPGHDHIVKKGAPTYEKAVADAVSALQKVLLRGKKD